MDSKLPGFTTQYFKFASKSDKFNSIGLSSLLCFCSACQEQFYPAFVYAFASRWFKTFTLKHCIKNIHSILEVNIALYLLLLPLLTIYHNFVYFSVLD